MERAGHNNKIGPRVEHAVVMINPWGRIRQNMAADVCESREHARVQFKDTLVHTSRGCVQLNWIAWTCVQRFIQFALSVGTARIQGKRNALWKPGYEKQCPWVVCIPVVDVRA